MRAKRQTAIRRFSIRSILLLTLAVAVVAATRQPKSAAASLQFVKLAPSGDALFRITNRSRKPIYYYGYGLDDPFYRVEAKCAGAWIQASLAGWCGTGAGFHRLERDASAEFEVSFFDSVDVIRVGMSCSESTNDNPQVQMIWSPETLISDAVDIAK